MKDTKLIKKFITETLAVAAGGNMYASSREASHANSIKYGAGGNLIADLEQQDSNDIQDGNQSACVLIRSEDGKILAVSRKDDPNDFGMPGGKVDPGESPLEAAGRELEEETGLTATGLNPVYSEYDGDTHCTTYVGKVDGEIDTPESGVIRWVDPEVLLQGSFGPYNRNLFKQLGIE